MERILVTGGAGFIGSNACNILSTMGYSVVALDNLSLGTPSNLDPAIELINGDDSSLEDLERSGKVDYIVHLAGSSSAPMFTDDLKKSILNNVSGYIQVLEYGRGIKVKKILYASTSSIYGNNLIPLIESQNVVPSNFYSVSKHCMEEISHVYAATYGMEIIGFRFMSIYGPNEEHKGRFANLVSQFIWGIELGRRPVLYGDGGQTRDFTNVRDIVQAFCLALHTTRVFGSTIFNVGTAEAINLRQLVDLINKVKGTRLEPQCVENPVKSGYIRDQRADLTKISAELGYSPTVRLEDGIAEIVRYRSTRRNAPASMSF